MPAFTRRDMNWLYEAEPDPSRNGRVDIWPAGKVLGGGSAINGMMFVRGHRLDYERWAAEGATGWDYASLLPVFRRMECWESGADAFRGGDGPQAVSPLRIEHPLNAAMLQAMQESGIPYNADLNGELAEGAGPVQASQQRGWRHSTAQAYIRPARRRKNLRVVQHCVAAQLLLEGGGVVGVACQLAGDQRIFRAPRVIVSAGALASPLLLMRSGIGAASDLRRHGIVTLVELPGVGRNLQEHAVARFGVRLRVDTLTSALSPFQSLRHGVEFLLRRRGPLTTAIAHVHALVRTRPDLSQPDVQILFAPADHRLTERGAVPCREPTVSVGVGLCQTHARGEVQLRSSRPQDPPRIVHALLQHTEDLRALTAGCRLARRIVHAPAFASFLEAEIAPGPSVQSDADWEHYLRDNTGLMYHPSGTCRMGTDAQAVVDPQLRVLGVEGLYVADASVIPSIPAGNINATCIMIGERAAELVRAHSRR
jgi:choline dehydrogenase